MKRLEANLEEIHDYNIDVFNRQIYLCDRGDNSDRDLDYNVASQFIKNFLFLDKDKDDITIHLQSQGGDWYAGFAIYDTIANGQSFVKIICHGAVMSIATVILQAADERVAMPNSIFMFHEGQQNISGTYKQVQSSLGVDKKSREDMINIYAKKCSGSEHFLGKSHSKIKGFIKSVFNSKEDWYLTPEEALKFGLIDSIYNG